MMLSLAVNWQLLVFQFNVETVFLYSSINASIYVSQVLGFEDTNPKKRGWVWKLNKSLYGTKQAPCMWKQHLVQTLSDVGFVASILDKKLFHNNDFSILLHMHANDGLVFGKSCQQIVKFLEDLKRTYSLKINERPNWDLGYTFDWRKGGSLYIHQLDFFFSKFRLNLV